MSTQDDSSSVILVSNDGFQFIVRKSAATAKSPAIRSMLDKRSNFTEAIENKIVFQNMSHSANELHDRAPILEKVCQYFYYFEKYKGCVDVPEPDFISPELALELLFVADFLDC
ncbi:BTB/POZ protein [Geopyxis carbonaria]|nr:BTB/POZ protein [Geopyxis carbonaria]